MKLLTDQDKSMALFRLFVRRARPIKDLEIQKVVGNITGDYILSSIEHESDITEFESQFFHWVQRSQNVFFNKSPDFHVAMCSGITDAFHHFYLTFPEKSVVVLSGEYPYHRDYYASLQKPLHRFSPGILTSDHIVILSLPFSATGNIHPDTELLLNECEQKNIPILLDLAFLGLGCTVNVNHYMHFSCVHSIAFSFSKLFFLGRFRIGLYWSKQQIGPLFTLKTWNYSNWAGAAFARTLMEHFTFDHLSTQYRPLQKNLCEQFHLTPSDSVLFGLDQNLYPDFHREKTINRLCLSPAMEYLKKNEDLWN